MFQDIMQAPDRAIPSSVLAKAEGIAIFPSTLRGGFIVGGHHGRGVLSVKSQDKRSWSPPAFLSLTGGSFGAQIGGQAIDIVLVIVNRRGIENLLKNQFKIGGDASAAVGPVGRSAEASTDVQMRAEILSYSRARGLFAGISLNGSSVREDRDSNEAFYGQPLRTRQVVLDGEAKTPQSPEAMQAWFAALKPHFPAVK